MIKSLLATGQLESGQEYDFDFDHQFIETEKYDAKTTYKKFLGYRMQRLMQHRGSSQNGRKWQEMRKIKNNVHFYKEKLANMDEIVYFCK